MLVRPAPFADELAQKALNREELFNIALDAVAASQGNAQVLRGLLHGIDLVDHAMAGRCIPLHPSVWMRKAAEGIPAEQLWVNPDCGLKTRGWPEVEASLSNLVNTLGG